ncbi:MAG TPA: PPE family protein [Mycobacterium sp.]|uniref:PPE family protein n=1 Tax=Mycobacterium sp. TaxID=1785 RepID=UPI002D2581A9|nr:PPE family protein [Mycobacterium sp.]HXY66708.1 PPE family protein [Mycobacterium sp.]
MDFGAFPPEFNSARMYAGPGSGPMLAAASAWDVLAAELGSAASGYSSVVTSLAEGSWLGPASASMAAAATPYVDWMSTTATQAEETAYQARAAAAAYEAAFAMTVPPAAVAANRAQLAALVATNIVGQNTPAIAATEALYAEMWAQDATAMYGYAGSSAAASTVTPFGPPPETTNAAGTASQAGTVAQATGTSSSAGVQSTLSQVVSTVPNALQELSSPMSASVSGFNPFAPGSNQATTGIAGLLNTFSGTTGSAFGSFFSSGFWNGLLSGNWFNPASVSPAVTSALADIGFLAVAGQGFGGLNPAMLTGATPSAMSAAGLSHVGSAIGAVGSPGLGESAVSAGMGRATLVGAMSVPQSWAAATPGASAPLMASPSGGWAYAPGAGVQEAGMPGVPGMPGMPMAGSGGRGFGFAAPRYGFRPTVVAHPPAAG